jgi:hypothetical protein
MSFRTMDFKSGDGGATYETIQVSITRLVAPVQKVLPHLPENSGRSGLSTFQREGV